MTKEEALKGVINFPLPKKTWEKALIDAGVAAAYPYTKDDKKEIDLCAIELLLTLLTSPDIKEGDYSITLPSESKLKSAYYILINKWGEPDRLPKAEAPTVEGASPW